MMTTNTPAGPSDLHPSPNRRLTELFGPAYWERAQTLSEAQTEHLVHTILGWEARHDSRPQRAKLHRDRAIAVVMVMTGITIRELCNLQMDDLIHNSTGLPALQVGTPPRCLPLPVVVAKAISRWLSLRPVIYGHEPSVGQPPLMPLFVADQQKPITPFLVQQVLQRLRQESGIAFSIYDLRHGFILRMVAHGCPPDSIASMLGRPSRHIINLYSSLLLF